MVTKFSAALTKKLSSHINLSKSRLETLALLITRSASLMAFLPMIAGC